MYSSSSPRSGSRSTSPYPLFTSNSHSGIGTALGFMSSPFVQDNDYRPLSPSRSPLSTPTTPTSRSHLFQDLPYGLHHRYNDAQEYLQRARHTFSPPRHVNRSKISSPTYSSYTPSYRSSDWQTNASSYRRPYSSRSSSRYDSTYESLPATPYSNSRTSTPFTPRAGTPPKTSVNTTTVITDRSISPSITYVPARPSSRLEGSSSPVVPIEDTQTLLKVSDHVTHELDKKVSQSDRFLHDMDEKLTELDRKKKEELGENAPSRVGLFDREETPKADSSAKSYADHIEYERPRRSHREETENNPKQEFIREYDYNERLQEKNNEPSFDEVKQQSPVRSMENSANFNNNPRSQDEDTSPTTRRRSTNARSIENSAPSSLSNKSSSAPGFEYTVSSYELRKKESPKEEEDVIKKYMPWIIGGVIAFIVLLVILSNARSAKKATPKSTLSQPAKAVASTISHASKTLEKSLKAMKDLKDPTLGMKELGKEMKQVSNAVNEAACSITQAVKKVQEVSKGFKEVSKTVSEVVKNQTLVTKEAVKSAKGQKVKNITGAVKVMNETAIATAKIANTTVKISKKIATNATSKAKAVKIAKNTTSVVNATLPITKKVKVGK